MFGNTPTTKSANAPPNSTEEYRRQCEVRTLIRWARKDKNWFRVQKYLESKPVQARAEKLKTDVREQFRKGNQGKNKEWIE